MRYAPGNIFGAKDFCRRVDPFVSSTSSVSSANTVVSNDPVLRDYEKVVKKERFGVAT